MEAVIHVDEHIAVVANGALDLLPEVRARANGLLRCDDSSRAEPAFEEIEKVYSVLDKDAPALCAIPEPMLGRKMFIGGVVLEVAMEHLAQRLGFDQPVDRVNQRVVALHEVGDDQHVARFRQGDHRVRLLNGQSQRLFANDVLGRLQGEHGLGMMEERRYSTNRPKPPPRPMTPSRRA